MPAISTPIDGRKSVSWLDQRKCLNSIAFVIEMVKDIFLVSFLHLRFTLPGHVSQQAINLDHGIHWIYCKFVSRPLQ